MSSKWIKDGMGKETKGVRETPSYDGVFYVSTEAISDEELRAFMNAMNKRYGLDFTHYEIKSLKRGMGRLLMKHGMKSMLDLWSRILKDDDFFRKGIDDLLVNLTEMFRNPDAWEFIRDKLLVNYKPEKGVRIWHAGCSTGEEVYTMAILLQEKNLLDKSRILATDLSTKALNKAKSAKYEYAILESYLKPFLKLYPDRTLKSYFYFEDNYALVLPQYNKNIRFRHHNLVSDSMAGNFDIVFCRNVLIYFDEKLKNHVLDLIYDSLPEGGILVIGYYDIMTEYGKSLFDTLDMKTKVYQKK